MIFSRGIHGKSYPMSKGCCGIFLSHHMYLVFFSFSFPGGEIFQDSALFVTRHSLKRSRANTAKSRQPQVSWGQQCFVWCEVITKLDNINTIMLWSLPVILVNFSFFSLHRGIFSSHHIRLVFFLFFHEGGIFFKILICLSLSPT